MMIARSSPRSTIRRSRRNSTKTGWRPIAPKNVKSWMATAKGRGLCFQFWEWCSGSGRLSLLLLMASFIVGFPVDYRCGWDIAHPPHQRLLHECLTEFKPDMLFGGPWSVASANKDPVKRLDDRNRELPTLEFLHDNMLWQHKQGRAFTAEQPFGSDMFKSSPMARLLDHEGVRLQRFDQCMLGAQDETGRPVRKASGFLTNRSWKHVRKRCNGHKAVLMVFFKVAGMAAIVQLWRQSIPKGSVMLLARIFGLFSGRMALLLGSYGRDLCSGCVSCTVLLLPTLSTWPSLPCSH